MKEILEIKVEEKIVSVLVNSVSTQESVEFVTESGKKIGFNDVHSQDCCESVYADFSIMKYAKEEIKKKETIDKIIISGIEDMGFLISLKPNYGASFRYFISCYNIQNGYYSSQLDLEVNNNGVKSKIDISNLANSQE